MKCRMANKKKIIIAVSIVMAFTFLFLIGNTMKHEVESANAEKAVAEYSLGDVTEDGEVNLSDVTMILKGALRIISLNENQLKLADINGEGKITLEDVILVLKYSLKIIDNLGEERLPEPDNSKRGEVLVVYFSCTYATKTLAESMAEYMKADIYEIVPQVPYTEEDLAYYTDCRADREQNDINARPAISGSVEDFDKYDIIFLGYPIWHGQAPRIISTLLESYNFDGKTIVPFCTSHSSGIGSSDKNLYSLADGAVWLSGRRFASGVSKDIVADWIDSLDLPKNQAVS